MSFKAALMGSTNHADLCVLALENEFRTGLRRLNIQQASIDRHMHEKFGRVTPPILEFDPNAPMADLKPA